MTLTIHRASARDKLRIGLLKAVFKVLPTFSAGPEARSSFDGVMAKVPKKKGVIYERGTVGGVSGWWCLPEGVETDCAILYLHGGAYVIGSADSYRAFVSHVVFASKLPAFVADYGLAPERPFPAALADARAVHSGLVRDGRRVALFGDSAGGGLALALLLTLLDNQVASETERPFATVALSAWTDLSLTGDSLSSRARIDPLLSREVLEQCATQYLVDESASDPQASPLFGSFDGCPPTMLHVGTDEVLLDDTLRLADRIARAGGDLDVHIWSAMIHVFQTNTRLQASQSSLALCGDFLKRQSRRRMEAGD